MLNSVYNINTVYYKSLKPVGIVKCQLYYTIPITEKLSKVSVKNWTFIFLLCFKQVKSTSRKMSSWAPFSKQMPDEII